MPPEVKLEALIFDVDGTLAETEEAHRFAFNETFAELGFAWHWSVDDYRRLLRTTGGKERMKVHASAMGEAVDDETLARIHRAKTRRYGELLARREIELRPGISRLLADAAEAGIRLAVATTTNRPNVDALIEATLGKPALEVFEVIAAGDEVKAKKPAPDVYLEALRRLQLPAANCLALEDSRNGLQSARAAGIATLVSPSRYTTGEDFTGALAVMGEFTKLASIADARTLHSSGVAA